MKSKYFLLLFLFFIPSFALFAQDQKVIDSLYNVFQTSNKDTVKVNAAHQLFYKYVFSDTTKAKSYCQKIKIIAEKTNSKKAITTYNNDMGIYYYYHGNYPLSISYFEKTIITRKELGDKKGESAAINNIGLNYASQGNFVKAIEYYQKSLKIDDELGNLRGVSDSYSNIGIIHYQQNNYSQANDYYQKSLQILNELVKNTSNDNDRLEINKSISACYTNIGLVYYSQKKLNKALECYQKSLKMAEDIGDKQAMSQGYNNIGMVYDDQMNFTKAIDYYQKAVVMLEAIDDKGGVVVVLNNIATLKNRQKKYIESIIYSEKSLALCKETGLLDDERIAWGHLAVSYKGLKNFEKSLNCYERSMHLKDSIFNIEKNNQFSEMEAKYNNEKKQKEIELLNKNKELQKTEIKRQTTQKYAFVIGFILMLTLAFVSFNSFRQKRKANKILSKQKVEIEERNEELNMQNEEIRTQRDEIEAQRDMVSTQKIQIETIYSHLTDSIHYAERIQKAILPSKEFMDGLLNEYFILFKPKDIVSGDFYYVAKRNHFIIAAVADCTGHGVPGAFMSMLGVSFLNEIIAKEHIHQADQVLNELRNYVVKSLQQKGVSGEQKDGMDISFVVIDTTTNTLQYSGANNPLYVIAKEVPINIGTIEATTLLQSKISNIDNTGDRIASSRFIGTRNDEYRLIELKADKMPVSIYINMNSFTNHVVEIKKGDIIYLSSDGFSDQFGGPSAKKFYSKQLKQILENNCDKPMKDQHDILEKAIEDWKTKYDKIYPQTDDITVMGIRV